MLTTPRLGCANDTINYVYEKMDVYETKEKMSGIYKGKGKKKQWQM